MITLVWITTTMNSIISKIILACLGGFPFDIIKFNSQITHGFSKTEAIFLSVICMQYFKKKDVPVFSQTSCTYYAAYSIQYPLFLQISHCSMCHTPSKSWEKLAVQYPLLFSLL